MGNVETMRTILQFIENLDDDANISIDCIGKMQKRVQLFCSFEEFQCIADELSVKVNYDDTKHWFIYRVADRIIEVITMGSLEDRTYGRKD